MRKPTLLALSAALILAVWASPTLAQAAPAAAPAPAVAAPAPAAVSAVAAPVAPTFALAGLASGASTCSATAPFPAPSVLCPYCPPGYVQCGYPFCRCCKGGL